MYIGHSTRYVGPHQRLNQCLVHWKHRVLPPALEAQSLTRPPGNSQNILAIVLFGMTKW